MNWNVIHRVFIIIGLFVFSGCSSGQWALIESSSQELLWPPAPQTPRIKFLNIISRFQEKGPLDSSKGLSEAWRDFTGKREERIFIAPYGVTADDEGNLYVVDRDTGLITVINTINNDSFFFKYEGDEGSGSEAVGDFPIGIAVAKSVGIFVTYPKSGSIRLFDRKGNYKGKFGKGVRIGRPTGVAVDMDDDRLYVVDTTEHNVKIFTLKGELINTFGMRGDNDGALNYPTHIFVGQDGYVYVTDELNYRVQIYSKDGAFISKIGSVGETPGTFQALKGVAVDSEGNIYVADPVSDHIQIFNSEGELLLIFGRNGYGPGEFGGATGLFIDKSDKIYVTDLYNARVQAFQYLGDD